jgi:hypothetical protein
MRFALLVIGVALVAAGCGETTSEKCDRLRDKAIAALASYRATSQREATASSDLTDLATRLGVMLMMEPPRPVAVPPELETDPSFAATLPAINAFNLCRQ